jgi:hypothetical protein
MFYLKWFVTLEVKTITIVGLLYTLVFLLGRS